jgi:ribonuclease HI
MAFLINGESFYEHDPDATLVAVGGKMFNYYDALSLASVKFVNPSHKTLFVEKLKKSTPQRSTLHALLNSLVLTDEGSNVQVFTDSDYVIGVCAGTFNAKKNVDIIAQIRAETQKRYVTFHFVPGTSDRLFQTYTLKKARESMSQDPQVTASRSFASETGNPASTSDEKSRVNVGAGQ